MNSKSNRSIALLLALAVALTMMVGPAAAAAPTNTASGLQDGDTINQTQTNASTTYLTQIEGSNSTDYDLEVSLNESTATEDGTVFATNTSAVNVSGPTASGTTYNLSITRGDLRDVPADAGENVTLDFTVFNASNTTQNTTFQVHMNNSEERSVVFIGDKTVSAEDDVTAENQSSWFGFGSSSTVASADQNDVGINGSQTDVFVVYGNESFSSAYATALDDTPGYKSYSAGDWVKDQQLRVAGTPYKTFSEEPPSAITDATGDTFTYGVSSTVDGQDAVRVELGDTYDDETSVDLATTSNEAYGFFEAFSISWRSGPA